MKIAMLYASWETFGEPWSTPHGVKEELFSRGHDVKFFNLYHNDGALPKNKIRQYSNQGIHDLHALFTAGQYRPDVIFVMDYGPWDAVAFDKKYFPGAILVSEAGDEPQSFRLQWPKASKVHLVLSPDKRCVQQYNTAGFNAIWWTHFADERVFFPRPEINVEFDCVTTCGGRRVTEDIQKALGASFNNERYFFGNAHAERLCMGKMVFQCSQFGEITRRIFEGMACGKMVITDRLVPETGLDSIFVDGQDIVYYNDSQDAIDKIRYFSSHDKEREEIALNGYRKVMQRHSVKQRIDVLEKEISKILC